MRRTVLFACLLTASAQAQTPADLAAGKAQFETRCGGCHGGDGRGGARAPDVVTPGLVPPRTDAEIRELIHDGLPDRGMPGFDVPEPELTRLVAYYQSLTAPAMHSPVAGDPDRGWELFQGLGCVRCHTRGDQTEIVGPDLTAIGAERTLGQLEEAIREPGAAIKEGYVVVDVRLKTGEELTAFARNDSLFDLQLQTFDGRFRFVSQEEIDSVERREASLMPRTDLNGTDVRDLTAFLSRQDGETGKLFEKRPASNGLTFAAIQNPKKGEWPTYNGTLDGNRHSRLTEINADNVSRLRPAWIFPVETPRDLETTPVVVDGVMYVTTVNKIHALDAFHGREIWTYEQPRTEGVMGDAGTGANRGVAIFGDRVYLATDHAHLIAVDRLTGRKVWDSEMADYRDHYGGTLAPLVVKDLVIGGVGGGDEGIRGFLAAFDAATGEERWRFWTVPAPGEPLAETWQGGVLPHGCGGTWLTGSYDPDLNLLYWPVGNPCPDMNGDARLGDNLYSDSILALNADTGELKWHYQYTPHDEFDWDANQTPILADIAWNGAPRKVLLHANRNGFFYVLDRVTGELLQATPFVEKLTWASGVGDDGRPILVPGKRPNYAGNVDCPGLAGATNWPSKSYDPDRGLFYLQATEYCNIFTKRDEKWERGKPYFGGAAKDVPHEPKRRYLRAIEVATGEIAWEVYQGDEGWRNWAGVLSTEGDVVFYGDDSGAFAAVRAADGAPLWRFHLNVRWHASPMTYLAKGKQFVAIGAGRDLVAFALPN